MKMVKYAIWLAAVIIVLAGPCGLCGPDPGIPDSVIIDSVSTYPTSSVTLPINFVNDEPLSAVQIVLDFDTLMLSIDSFTLEGTRLSYVDPGWVEFADSANLIRLWVSDWEGYIPEGSGPLCYLFFTAKSFSAGQSVPIDTARWLLEGPGELYTLFSDEEASTIDPKIRPGCITVLDAPPTPDSIYIDSLRASAGDQVAVNVYAYNIEPLSKIDLSIWYSSSSLILDTVITEGTRSQQANYSIQRDVDNNQFYVPLNYGGSPLPAGDGVIAQLIFNIDDLAPDELVILDSLSYLGVTPLQLTQAEEGGLTYIPYFVRGFINIRSSTDVAEIEEPNLPETFALEQNSPNPFNPATVIRFSLPRASRVKLDVYNILGQRVTRLVDENLAAGSYSVTFDGSDSNGRELASGVYFYKIEAGDFRQSKKMILLK